MSKAHRICFHLLPAAVAVVWLMLLLSASVARAAGLDEVETGQLLLQASTGGDYRPALQQASRVHFDISGMVATVTLEQSFKNDSSDWVEAVYAFPLPEQAAVRAMEMIIGERRIVGKIKEKSLAKKIYNDARAAGKTAGLVEQQRPNLFTNRVANIGPGEEIKVSLEYVQEVAFVQGQFALRFPMTITPRYIPGSPTGDAPLALEEADKQLELNPYLGWAEPTDQVPDADAISPLQLSQPGLDSAPVNSIEITVSLDMAMPLAHVDAPYHPMALTRDGQRYSLQLANGAVAMDRDFLLQWQPVTGSAPEAAFFQETVAGQHYGLLMVVPPAVAATGNPIARELVFVIDTSGSMGGVSIAQARQSLDLALQQLRPQDYFNVIEFNSVHRQLYPQAVAATRHRVQQAREFVRQLSASGGTEMLAALNAALNSASTDAGQGQRLRQIVFITDGAVGNETQLFEHISRNLGQQRLFTVGIGSAPNSWFMRKAAEFGRGAHIHIGDVAEVREKMAALFSTIAAPLAVDIAVNWPGAVVAWPQQVPDLYAGEPVLLAVHFPEGPVTGNVMVTGRVQGSDWARTLTLSGPATTAGWANHPGVASVWARRKIESLLDSLVTGAAEDEVRAQVLPLALSHHLMSPYTSFVAVEEVVSRPANSTLSKKPVPNTRPKGQVPQVFAYPATATLAPLHTWLGSLFLFLALMVFTLRRPEPDHVPA